MKMAAETYLQGQIMRARFCRWLLFSSLFFLIAQAIPSIVHATRIVCIDHQFSQVYHHTGISTDTALNPPKTGPMRGRIVDHILDVATHGQFANGGAQVTEVSSEQITVHYWANAKTKLNWHLVVYCEQ